MMAKRSAADITSVIALIGGPDAKFVVIENELGTEGMQRSVLVVSTSMIPALVPNSCRFRRHSRRKGIFQNQGQMFC